MMLDLFKSFPLYSPKSNFPHLLSVKIIFPHVGLFLFEKFLFEKMNLKMSTDQEMMDYLKKENDYMTFLLEAFEIPETVESK